MKTMSGPPQRLYLVARTFGERYTVGDVYGPYVTLRSAKKTRDRLGDAYTIIESLQKWLPAKEGA